MLPDTEAASTKRQMLVVDEEGAGGEPAVGCWWVVVFCWETTSFLIVARGQDSQFHGCTCQVNCLQNSIISLDPTRPMGYDQIPEIPLFGGIRTGKIPVWVRHPSKSGETVLGSQFFVRVALGP